MFILDSLIALCFWMNGCVMQCHSCSKLLGIWSEVFSLEYCRRSHLIYMYGKDVVETITQLKFEGLRCQYCKQYKPFWNAIALLFRCKQIKVLPSGNIPQFFLTSCHCCFIKTWSFCHLYFRIYPTVCCVEVELFQAFSISSYGLKHFLFCESWLLKDT